MSVRWAEIKFADGLGSEEVMIVEDSIKHRNGKIISFVVKIPSAHGDEDGYIVYSATRDWSRNAIMDTLRATSIAGQTGVGLSETAYDKRAVNKGSNALFRAAKNSVLKRAGPLVAINIAIEAYKAYNEYYSEPAGYVSEEGPDLEYPIKFT